MEFIFLYIVYILRGSILFQMLFYVSDSVVDWVGTFELWFGEL